MRILVLNKDGTILKYLLVDMPGERIIARGSCFGIGSGHSFFKHAMADGEALVIEKDVYSDRIAVKELLDILKDQAGDSLKLSEIERIACYFMDEEEMFHGSMIVTSDTIKAMKANTRSAFYLQDENMRIIEACHEFMPGIPVMAMPDSLFQGLGTKANRPKGEVVLDGKNGRPKGRKYFALSHKYAMERACEILDKRVEELKFISCRFGTYSSISAAHKGMPMMLALPRYPLSVETNEGDHTCIENIDRYVFLEETGVKSGDENRAVEEFYREARRHIGGFSAVMGGLDILVFTGRPDTYGSYIRKNIIESLQYLGIEVDWENREIKAKTLILNSERSKIHVLVVPEDQELAVAREVHGLMQDAGTYIAIEKV